MSVKITLKSLSEAILLARKKSGLSQQELAELSGVGKTLIFDLEKQQANIQIEKLLKILNVLNLNILIETKE